MDQGLPEQQGTPTHKRASLKALIIGPLFIVVLIIVALYVASQFSTHSALEPADIGVSTQKVGGWLDLSLAPSSEQFQGVFPFISNVATNQLVYIQADQLVGEKKAFTQQYRFSPDGKWAVFIGQGLLAGSTTTLRAAQIYQADVSAGKDTPTLITSLRAGKVISDDTDFKRAPVVSDTGGVLYMSVLSDVPFSDLPDVWEIVYVPVNGNAERITVGTYPQWVDAHRFIFLKSDGLYMYDIDTGGSQLLSGAASTITTNSMLDLSDDKTMIAWSIHDEGIVTILRVLDWNTPTITTRGTISVAGTWPVIAPDSSALAILTSDPTPGADPGLHIALYSLETLQPIMTRIGLLDSDPARTALTDWTF